MEQIKKHLLTKKSITSWDAIMLYKATRLAAFIHCLRKEHWIIETKEITQKDTNGNDCTFAKYVYKGKRN